MSQETAEQQTPPVLVLCRDLFFGSKITATSKAVGVPVRMLRDPAKLSELNASRRLIVDLNQPGYLDAATTWKRATGGEVSGFVKHTDTQTIAAARSAGIDAIYSQGAFTARLDSILAGAGASVDPACE
jgi:hypothetical protein